MAAYSFETMSASDAASFTASDYLIFITKGATANQVTVEPYGNGSSGSNQGSGINLTYGGKTLTFPNDLSTASKTGTGHILFQDNSHLLVGTQAGAVGGGNSLSTPDGTFTPVGSTNSAGAFVDPQTVYALGGDDTLNFSTEAAGRAIYLNGGFGADTIMGGDANSHIYGNSMTSKPGDVDSSGVVDGADTITAGAGSNYINGNAGADRITVGTANTAATGSTSNASTGTNRVFGGADNDTIMIMGNGHNSVNGNTGSDTITDMGSGDNTLRGGQGDDVITGGSGHSVLMGDIGNDTIIVHGREATGSATQHIDVISGGAGSDTFNFSAAGAGQAALFGQTVYYQEITDFTHGVDKLIIPTQPMATGNVGHSSTVFANVHDAEVYAQSQLSATGGNQGGTPVVESLSVGSANNTYLFYNETGNTAANNGEVAGLGIIHLDNISSSSVTYTDFATMTGTVN